MGLLAMKNTSSKRRQPARPPAGTWQSGKMLRNHSTTICFQMVQNYPINLPYVSGIIQSQQTKRRASAAKPFEGTAAGSGGCPSKRRAGLLIPGAAEYRRFGPTAPLDARPQGPGGSDNQLHFCGKCSNKFLCCKKRRSPSFPFWGGAGSCSALRRHAIIQTMGRNEPRPKGART